MKLQRMARECHPNRGIVSAAGLLFVLCLGRGEAAGTSAAASSSSKALRSRSRRQIPESSPDSSEGFAGPSGISSPAASSAGPAEVGPVLFHFVKELHSEAQAGLRQAAAVQQWCRDSLTTKANMITIFQRHFDEASIAQKQLELEEKRLSSEARLSNSTQDEKQRQLEDAAVTAQMALEEFNGEKQRLDRALNATTRALRLAEMRMAQNTPLQQLQQQQGQQPPLVQQELGLGDGAATLGAADVQQQQQLEQLQQFAALGLSGEEASLALPSTPSQKLIQHLRQMRVKLARERGAMDGENGAAVRKMRLFMDRLNASIVETQSQVAAISAEASQRKRQRARLAGRSASLEALVKAVEASDAATRDVCSEDEHHRGDISALITAESNVVADLLKSSSVPMDAATFTAEAAQQPASAAFQASPSGGAAAAFLQVSSEATGLAAQRALSDLRRLAGRFPGEADFYADATKQLGVQSSADQDDDAPSVDYPMAANATDIQRDPLSSIRMFVGSDAGAGAGSDGAAGAAATDSVSASGPAQATQGSQAVRDVYSGLINRVRSRSREVSEENARCELLSREAAVDEAALARALKMVTAKQHIAEVVAAEYTQSVEYTEAQEKALQKHLSQLEEAVRQTDQLASSGSERLNDYVQQLLSIAARMGQEGLDTRAVQNLVQKVEEHRALLQRRATDMRRQADTAAATDRSLLRLLGADAQQSRRQLHRAKAESQLLASRVRAKADDQSLGEQFQDLVASVCSSDKLSMLQRRSKELLQEQAALKSAASEAADVQGTSNSAMASAVEALADLLPKPQQAASQ